MGPLGSPEKGSTPSGTRMCQPLSPSVSVWLGYVEWDLALRFSTVGWGVGSTDVGTGSDVGQILSLAGFTSTNPAWASLPHLYSKGSCALMVLPSSDTFQDLQWVISQTAHERGMERHPCYFPKHLTVYRVLSSPLRLHLRKTWSGQGKI